MSTTQTSHEPDRGELEHVAAQSEDRRADAHASGHDAAVPGHDVAAGGHGDDGHGAEALGPVDVGAWVALALGIAAGLVVVACLVITNSLVAKPSV